MIGADIRRIYFDSINIDEDKIFSFRSNFLLTYQLHIHLFVHVHSEGKDKDRAQRMNPLVVLSPSYFFIHTLSVRGFGLK